MPLGQFLILDETIRELGTVWTPLTQLVKACRNYTVTDRSIAINSKLSSIRPL